ncbi:HAMP domain-containing histidine kinase [Planosporangium flavigriseum]|uniref:Signal transduction histidine-protein kinase/phosphatase MprB n=1 Tax=Planosporangium flavigriseum TaxID=373681 RepID=A0A8J3LMN6_9ACTN|nr:HAMP domain-containing sensor histidine kinase [Planosporangium flavigriseum]NJC66024.1 HAMP domain-containing histidine kinase [Planosporangium flavigriseum]GIG74512.1 two-component sensor histidine kinase [Planosporangium flavigriseum]
MAVTAMVALAFLIPLGLVVAQLARERALADAERQTAIVVAVLMTTTDPTAVDRAIAAAGGPAAGRVAVHGLGGGSVGQRHARAEEIAMAAGQLKTVVTDVPGGLSYLEPVDIGQNRNAVVEVFIPSGELTRGVHVAWYALTAVALGLVVASVWVGDRLAAKVVGSARGLADAASALGNGQLDVRVEPSGPRELAEAGLAFNVMAERVKALLADERELVADLSHRLRTPLTALRLDAETLDDHHAAERIRHAIGNLELEVDEIIRAARKPRLAAAAAAAAAEPGEHSRCDASDVVRERMKFWSAVAGDQGRRCEAIGVDAPAPVPVARAELAAALDALLGNVFRYTPQGVPLEVTVSRRDGYVAITVEDGGPGIADPDRALRRGETNHGSTGLGLDIVKRVAYTANGTVNIARGRLGGASIVVLLADAEWTPPASSRFGFVGRLSRDPAERRRRRDEKGPAGFRTDRLRR